MSDITYEELIRYRTLQHVRKDSWSDITYEELILLEESYFSMISPCFGTSDITYEELILLLHTSFSNYTFFQSDITYEELILAPSGNLPPVT